MIQVNKNMIDVQVIKLLVLAVDSPCIHFKISYNVYILLVTSDMTIVGDSAAAAPNQFSSDVCP